MGNRDQRRRTPGSCDRRTVHDNTGSDRTSFQIPMDAVDASPTRHDLALILEGCRSASRATPARGAARRSRRYRQSTAPICGVTRLRLSAPYRRCAKIGGGDASAEDALAGLGPNGTVRRSWPSHTMRRSGAQAPVPRLRDGAPERQPGGHPCARRQRGRLPGQPGGPRPTPPRRDRRIQRAQSGADRRVDGAPPLIKRSI